MNAMGMFMGMYAICSDGYDTVYVLYRKDIKGI